MNPFKHTRTLGLLLLLPLLLLALSACGTIPLLPEFSHQGRLLGTDGKPVPDGNYQVDYAIYQQASGGTAVYTDTQTIAVQDGLFNTGLGPDVNMDPEIFSSAAWLEVTVEGETLTPRQRLQGAPFAASLVSGAVVQGVETIEREFNVFQNTGAALTVWNRDATETGGHGLLVMNQAAPGAPERENTAALLAIAAGGDVSEGTGAYGAIIRSEEYRGMYSRAGTNFYAGVFDSNVGIQLTGGGSCSGCALSYPARNTGGAAIAAGDFVTISGVVLDPDLNIPVMQVRKAQAGDTAVIGVAAAALQREATADVHGAQMGGFNQIDGDAAADAYLSVVVQGLVQARVGAVAPDMLGQSLDAAAAAAPATGRLMSAPQSDGLAWVMLSGQ